MTSVIEREKAEYKTALIPQAQLSEVLSLDKTAKEYQRAIIEAEESEQPMLKGLLIARATRTLQKMLTPDLMTDIMDLQGSPLGFKTDRDKARDGTIGYPVDVVRDVVIQALMRGVQVTGNQFNIIGGNLYVTKEGYEQRLQNFEGLTNFEVEFEVPDTSRAGVAFVGCVARWQLSRKPGLLECTKNDRGDYRIPIRVNAGQSDDAILGKAKSKLFRKVFDRLTGMGSNSIDEDGTIDAESVTMVVVPVEPVIKPVIEPVPEAEALDATSEEQLTAALKAITTRPQFEGAKQFWRNRAKNREFTSGQIETIKAKFDGRESKGFV